ncbi:MAG: hypothetical protein JWM96_773 [Alphaproteobacteria bacterium]|nr:hypothetical protein [Alphaproteobacteria bacterium]
MATKSTKTRKAQNTRTASANSTASNNTRSQTGSAFNFADVTKNFVNPTQFWNFGNNAAFQPANFQSLIEQVIETSQKNLEAVTACTQLYVERAKESMEDYAAFTTTMMQETASTVQGSLSNTKADPRNKMEEMGEFAKYCLEKAATQARKSAEGNIEVANKISTTLKKRLTATVDELRDAA